MSKKTDDAGPQRLRLKASLISNDGGKTWVVSRQYYVCDIASDSLLDVRFTEYAVVDRIIRHLELTFVAEKPPPAYAFEQVALMAAEESGDYE